MDTIIASPALNWWHNEPVPVRAVIDLANVEGCEAIAAVFAPGMSDTLTVIGSQLVEIDRLGSGDTDLLATYYPDARIAAEHADELADELITQLKADVTTSAQLCASVLTARARKLRAA